MKAWRLSLLTIFGFCQVLPARAQDTTKIMMIIFGSGLAVAVIVIVGLVLALLAKVKKYQSARKLIEAQDAKWAAAATVVDREAGATATCSSHARVLQVTQNCGRFSPSHTSQASGSVDYEYAEGRDGVENSLGPREDPGTNGPVDEDVAYMPMPIMESPNSLIYETTDDVAEATGTLSNRRQPDVAPATGIPTSPQEAFGWRGTSDVTTADCGNSTDEGLYLNVEADQARLGIQQHHSIRLPESAHAPRRMIAAVGHDGVIMAIEQTRGPRSAVQYDDGDSEEEYVMPA